MAAEQLISELNAIRTRAQQLVTGLSPEQHTRRADPAKWSIAECLQHLNRTAAAVQPKIAQAIEQGKKENMTGTEPFPPGPMGRLLIWIAEPPPKFRMRAPKEIAPQLKQGDPSALMTEFMEVQNGWERLIRDSEGMDQRRVKVSSLFPGLPRMRLAAPIPWMLAHQRRHLWQAEDVKRQITQQSLIPSA